MLHSYPTKNGTGITVLGNYADFNVLYDIIHHFSETLNEYKSEEHKAQYQLLMNFAYEIRKAYSGQRLIEKHTYDGDNIEHTLYGVQFVWTDMLVFIAVLRHNAGYSQSDKLHQATLYNLEYTVEESLFKYDAEGANRVKEFIGQRINVASKYAFIIYQALHIHFVSEKAGKPRFRKIPQMLTDYFSLNGIKYKSIVSSFEASAKEQKCDVTDLEFSGFPEIIW